MQDSGTTLPSLLGAGDPAPVERINPDGRVDLLLLCDHASAAVPAALGLLGLAPAALERHIGWDIGAAAVTRRLAELLGAPAVLSGFSRLVIDCNRLLDDPTSIPPMSDGQAVPGNQDLSPAAREQRAASCFWPYQRAIEAQLSRALGLGAAPVILSIHSFTPRFQGFDRPWQAGVLWDRDPRIPLPLIAGLSAEGLTVGDNEPYSARSPEGFTLHHHAAPRGLPHVLIELRQDEIDTDAGVHRFAGHLMRALQPILANPDLYRSAVFP
jgi:predicted N-formylglutamate amidohydrolase